MIQRIFLNVFMIMIFYAAPGMACMETVDSSALNKGEFERSVYDMTDIDRSFGSGFSGHNNYRYSNQAVAVMMNPMNNPTYPNAQPEGGGNYSMPVNLNPQGNLWYMFSFNRINNRQSEREFVRWRHWTRPSNSPVPIPASIIMFGSGMLGLISLKRKYIMWD